LTEAATKPGPCQVSIHAEDPCPRRAEVEILGVAFCGPCARKQEAYFAIGELTHEEAQDLHTKTLAEVLESKRQESAGSRDGIAATMLHELSVVDEAKPLAFRKI
jgi:hypothetical protein